MSNLSRTFCLPALILAATSLAACNSSDKADRLPLTPPPVATSSGNDAAAIAAPALPAEAVAALDAANAAYRTHKFDVATAKYREAATLAPTHAAPWFGLYMVASELKQTALADSAMAHVKALSTDPAALGAHAEVASATAKALGAPLPPDHAARSQLPPGHPGPTATPEGHPSVQSLPPGHPAPKAGVTPPTKRGAGGA